MKLKNISSSQELFDKIFFFIKNTNNRLKQRDIFEKFFQLKTFIINIFPLIYQGKIQSCKMQNKSKNESLKMGDIITAPQGEKYEVLQKINSKRKSQKELLPTLYDHIDTHIVKRYSNKVYYIMKRFSLFSEKSVKQSQIQSPSKEKNVLKQIKNKQLFHPNLMIVEQAFFEKHSISQKQYKTLVLIEQYCEEGDLAYFVKYETKKCLKQGKKETFQEKIISKWLLQILLALQHLHFNKQAHQVLTPNNIFLTPLGNLKLNEYYFVNSIAALKEVRKTKETASPLIQGYEPLVNQKKFKINEKKDIFDFGILISYLCHSKAFKEPKKQDKNKNFAHLPSSYSQELDTIYLNCINVKKTGVQVKDILRTPYFLEVMRQFIVDKKLNVSLLERIPIKKYTIHKKSIIPKTQKVTKKQDKNIKQQNEVRFPRIQKTLKPTDMRQSNRKIQKHEIKEMNENEVKKIMKASLEKLKSKLETKENLSKEKKVRKTSVDQAKDEKKLQKQKPKVLVPLPSSKDPNKATLKPPPSLPKNKNTSIYSPISEKKKARESRQSERSNQQNQRDHVTRSESASPQKNINESQKYQLTPQITFGKKTQTIGIVQSPIIQVKQPKPGTQMETMQECKFHELEKISENLAKIFLDLKIRQDDDQEFSFELNEEEEQVLRLTLKGEKQGVQSEENLMKTYKWKFEEIVSQLQQKYQPNLETIIQKTNEWDSNDLFVNQELLKRLKLQEGKQEITFGA